MMATARFSLDLARKAKQYRHLIGLKNVRSRDGNGIYDRWQNPVLTASHVPLFWRYDLNPATNPFLMERMGINCVFNPGAMYWNRKFILMARIEGADRKSFFAVAESRSGVDGFRFWDEPASIPETDNPDTNVYDMRLVPHEDGWIYGLFCTERRDLGAQPGDMSAAVAQCGIVRTKDLRKWHRLPDLKSDSSQQRNVVLHPEFVNGKYALYTRPQDSFLESGKGGGIGYALLESMEKPVIHKEFIIDSKVYHTIKELKNGAGPAPIRTRLGWLHIAHGVRNTAAGMRYVLYSFLADIKHPDRVLHRPGGYLIAPRGGERIGDVSNVVFCNGAAVRGNDIFIYYASSDTRVHVATTTIDKMLDYVVNTPEDPLRSAACAAQRRELIAKNLEFLKSAKGGAYRGIR